MFKVLTTTAIIIVTIAITSILSSLSTSQQALAQGNVTQETTSAANQTGEEMQSGMANTTQEAKSAGNQTGEEMQSGMNKTGEEGQSMLNQTGEGAQSLMDKAGETLQNINPFK
jgi:type II secretory pathway pseudopilin PulG